MADRMLIDASHEEETRVVVVRGNRIEEFDFESQYKKQLRGNIYLAKVTRVEPSLQAAFVDYGGNRHGFLAFAEIHPDYYQIPYADRQALLAEEQEEDLNDEDNEQAPAASNLSEADQPEADFSELQSEETVEEKPKPRRKPRRKSKKAEEAKAEAESAEEAAAEVQTAAETAEPAEENKSEDGAAEASAADDANTADATEEVAAAETDEASEDTSAPEAEAESDSSSDDDEDGKPEIMAAEVDADTISEEVEPKARSRRRRKDDDDDDDDDDNGEKEEIESVGAEDAMEEVPDRGGRQRQRKQYRIQEVIKRRQILLVQVAKEERGNKGAALTTYLSLAGRYSVLMPNTARGGGISRKITNPADRKRLKEIARGLEVPQGMGVILRTAGANRTKVEIKRDFEYLMRLWENVRTLTLNSTAPCLVYEEGSLIKRSIRDLYNKDISEIIVAGEEGYREAKDFMKMLMPSHAKVVQPYRDVHPIYSRSGIEAQLDRMLQPQVTLKSGGYLIINQTEALVAIDVNSGRSTREHSIEETALATNLEAAEEVARQLRLRDLAGLVVIDFIDMEEKRNNRAVEKKLKDCLKNDRARIQVGRISHFGLLEMSRQRIRASVLESTMQVCSHCGGAGHVRSESSVALHVLRGIEEYLLKNTTHNITVRTTPEIAIYLLNHKRGTIVDYETRFGVQIFIEADAEVGSQHFAIDRGDPVDNPVRIEALVQFAVEPEEDDTPIIEEDDEEDEEAPVAEVRSEEREGNRKRKRRRRRRGRRDNQNEATAQGDAVADDAAESYADQDDADAENGSETVNADAEQQDDDNQKRKRRRRGKRGGRRNRPNDEGDLEAEASFDDAGDEGASGAEADVAKADVAASTESAEDGDAVSVAEVIEAGVVVSEVAVVEEAPAETAAAVEEALGVAPSVEAEVSSPAEVAEATAVPAEEPVVEEVADAPEAEEAGKQPRTARTSASDGPIATDPVLTSGNGDKDGEEPKPKKVGWWQQRGFF